MGLWAGGKRVRGALTALLLLGALASLDLLATRTALRRYRFLNFKFYLRLDVRVRSISAPHVGENAEK